MTRLDTRLVTALLSRDSKDATYKFALLRAIVQCVTEQRAHKKIDANPFAWKAGDGSVSKPILPNAPYVISYPLGLLIYFWMFYYYPIFAHPVFIPQKNGESPDLDAGRTIAFRREFNRVIDYYRGKGGLRQFRYDLIHESVPGDIRPAVLSLMRKIRSTITRMPMKHLGFSIFNEHYSMVRSTSGTIREPSYAGLIRDAGRFMMHPELHDVLDEIGTLIIGHDSIIYGWADFTCSIARSHAPGSDLSREDMIALLHQAVDIPRDVGQVRRMLERERAGGLRCVWSGREIRGDLNIDHVLPYSLWQNNNLWNLLPVSAPVNSKKRDRIPTPGLIDRSAGRIREVWGLYAGSYGSQFYRELFEGLAVGRGGAAERAGGTGEPGRDVSGDFAVREAEGQSEIGRGDELDPAIGSLKQISAYLIDKRGFPEFDL